MTKDNEKARQSPPTPEEFAAVREIFRRREQNRLDFVERYGHIRPPMGHVMNGHTLAVVGGRIYKQLNAGPYGVVDLIHDNALTFFGEPYLEAEERKAPADRHPALQWMHTYYDHYQALKAQGNTDPGAAHIGASAAWFRFGYDLYTIIDNVTLNAPLRERLLDPVTFQAARHELRVAAICSVAGFDLKYEDETDNSRKHPEFIAVDRFSSTRIAVEAKSRHRRGVQGFNGGFDLLPGGAINIRDKVLDAYKKTTELPYYVFVDANMPPRSSESDWERWNAELESTMNDLAIEGYASPCPANAVFVSNDPSHYLGTERIGTSTSGLWIKHFSATAPRIPNPPGDLVGRFMKAFRQRVTSPEKFPDSNWG
jgi:hypothetical protein